MQRQVRLAPVAPQFSSCEGFSCAVQVLVIDHSGGPASVLVDTISLLLDREISVTLVDDPLDALRALDYYHFDVVVIGLDEQRLMQLSILPRIQREHSHVPILAVGRSLPRQYRQFARNYGAREVLNVPETASDLKALVARMDQRYLQVNI